jgi:ATP-dependent RNA helicase RhlE
MPPEIVALSQKILGNPEKVSVKPGQPTAERVEQALYYVAKRDKTKLLIHLLKDKPEDSTLVFSRTKHGADKIVKLLKRENIDAAAIHGNKSQGARQRVLGDFKDGGTLVLVATDIAARGIDVEELSLVVNYDLPNVPETYVHRIGRTGRARASGIAISFCSGEEKTNLRDIQKLIKQKIAVVDEHPFPDDGTEEPSKPQQQRPPRATRQPRQPKGRPENPRNSNNNTRGKRFQSNSRKGR